MGWTVELFRNGSVLSSVLTDANGDYQFGAVPPNDTNGDQYELRFTRAGRGREHRGARPHRSPPFTNGMQLISDIIVTSGSNLPT